MIDVARIALVTDSTCDLREAERQKYDGQAAQSSQPSVGEFMSVYAALLKDYDSVISVHISARLSGTVETATMAAQSVDPQRIRVVDSRKVSVGVGLVVQAVGEAIEAGNTLEEVAAIAETAADQTRVFGALAAAV